jgi:hypothetical protein
MKVIFWRHFFPRFRPVFGWIAAENQTWFRSPGPQGNTVSKAGHCSADGSDVGREIFEEGGGRESAGT